MSARVVEKHKTCAVTSLTYVRTHVRLCAVRAYTYVRNYLPSHTYGLRGGTYVRMRTACVRTHVRKRNYVRTYLCTYVRTYVRLCVRTCTGDCACHVRTYMPDRAFVIARATYVTDEPARRARTYVRTHVCAYAAVPGSHRPSIQATRSARGAAPDFGAFFSLLVKATT